MTTIAAWYERAGTAGGQDASQQAYLKAKTFLCSDLSAKEQSLLGLSQANTVEDFQDAVHSAASNYAAKPRSKALKWLTKLSSMISFYGSTLDVLVQHHPEYTALAWGAFKFLFTAKAVCNHERLIKELSKALYQIATMLPQVRLALHLYPTDAMQQAVVPLYVVLLRISVKSIKWYKHGRIKHMLDAVSGPWELNFEEDVSELYQHFATISSHASSAAHAELRDVHLDTRKVVVHHEEAAKRRLLEEAKLEKIGLKVALTEDKLESLASMIEQRTEELMRLAAAQKRIQEELAVDLQSQAEVVRSAAVAQTLAQPFIKVLPTPFDCLSYSKSFTQRMPSRTKLVFDTDALTNWSAQGISSVMILKSTAPRHMRKAMLDVLEIVRDSQFPILWAMPFRRDEHVEVTTTTIVKLLAIQALQLTVDGTISSGPTDGLRVLGENSSETQWLSILETTLRRVRNVFVIIDPNLLSEATDADGWAASEFIIRLTQRLAVCQAKVLVSSSSVDYGFRGPEETRSGAWKIASIEVRQSGTSKAATRLIALNKKRKSKKS